MMSGGVFGDVEAAHRDRLASLPCLDKPVDPHQLDRALLTLLG